MKRGWIILGIVIMLFIQAGDAPTEPAQQQLSIPQIQQTVSFFKADKQCPWRRTTQVFGRADQSSDGAGKIHTGSDVACRRGAEITSPFNCRVLKAEDSTGGWGTNVICKAQLPSGQNICYRVAHMVPGSLKVTKGDLINAGQTIGLEGTSGLSTGVHGHFQILDCNTYPYSLDDGYAGASGKFDQLRYFYNPLQFLREWKDANILHSSLNMVRHEADGSFSAHSWLSTVPQYIDASNVLSLSTNEWEQRFIRRGYRNPQNHKEAVYYKAKYLVTKQDNYRVTFRPFLPRKGTWQVFFKVPNDKTLNGTVKVRVHFKAWFHKPIDPLLIHEFTLNQGSHNHGKYLRLGGNINCLRGKNCKVEVITTKLNGIRSAGIESIKWKYVTDMYEEFYAPKAIMKGDENYWVHYPPNTELAIIRLSYAPWLTQYNVDLYATHRSANGRITQLPCIRSDEPGKAEYCIALRGKVGDSINIRVKTPVAPFCSGTKCYGILVSINRYATISGPAGFIPAGSALCADIGEPSRWYSKWLYIAGLTGIMSGVRNEDYISGNCLFKPAHEVKKAEFTKMIIKATSRNEPPACSTKPYNDVEVSDWFCPYVQELKRRLPSSFVWDGSAPTNFFPAQPLKREVAAYMTFVALKLTKRYPSDRIKLFCDLKGSRFFKEVLTLNYHNLIHGFRPDVVTRNCSYNFGPYDILNRAQAAKLAVSAFYSYYTKGF